MVNGAQPVMGNLVTQRVVAVQFEALNRHPL
jgi:hypothetical protein